LNGASAGIIAVAIDSSAGAVRRIAVAAAGANSAGTIDHISPIGAARVATARAAASTATAARAVPAPTVPARAASEVIAKASAAQVPIALILQCTTVARLVTATARRAMMIVHASVGPAVLPRMARHRRRA
jgi:hypothetical protein